MTIKSRRSSSDKRGQIERRSPTVFTFGMIAWWDTPSRPCVPEMPLPAATHDGFGRQRQRAKHLADGERSDDLRHVGDQALGQITQLRPGIGDKFLPRSVVELLSNLERSGCSPPEARATEPLQGGQVVQPRRRLALLFHLNRERARIALGTGRRSPPRPRASGSSPAGRAASGRFSPRRARLRQPRNRLSARKARISSSRRQTMARVGVFTRPTPMTAARRGRAGRSRCG